MNLYVTMLAICAVSGGIVAFLLAVANPEAWDDLP